MRLREQLACGDLEGDPQLRLLLAKAEEIDGCIGGVIAGLGELNDVGVAVGLRVLETAGESAQAIGGALGFLDLRLDRSQLGESAGGFGAGLEGAGNELVE